MNEQINDQYIKNYIDKFKKLNKRISKNSFSKEIINYLENRYNDSDSISESLYRILNNIEIRPTCVRCGNKVNFNSLTKGFCNHCSNSCAQGDPNIYKPAIQKKIDKYGYGTNFEKIKQTHKLKYGTEFALQRKEVHLKIKQTCLEKYGNENFRNIEKNKQTCLKKYGNEYYLNSNDCKEKTIKKFGVDNFRKTKESKEITSNYMKLHHDEIREKVKKTCLLKYGVDNVMKNELIKNKIDYKEQKRKEYITKRKNNSFNKSNIEDKSFILLKEKYQDILRQYKSKLYPFYCDFYIPSLDLYIECNYHWTHGGKTFEGNDNDLIKLNEWKEKNTQYFKNAINCWTIRDVNKRNIAKKNNLNYIEFWNINELKEWLLK